jgi:hypothetical protein
MRIRNKKEDFVLSALLTRIIFAGRDDFPATRLEAAFRMDFENRLSEPFPGVLGGFGERLWRMPSIRPLVDLVEAAGSARFLRG